MFPEKKTVSILCARFAIEKDGVPSAPRAERRFRTFRLNPRLHHIQWTLGQTYARTRSLANTRYTRVKLFVFGGTFRVRLKFYFILYYSRITSGTYRNTNENIWGKNKNLYRTIECVQARRKCEKAQIADNLLPFTIDLTTTKNSHTSIFKQKSFALEHLKAFKSILSFELHETFKSIP